MKLHALCICCVVGSAVLAAGCGSGGSAPGSGPGLSSSALPGAGAPTGATTAASGSFTPSKGQISTSQHGSLQITLSTDSTSYPRGVPVQIQLEVKNIGTATVAYEAADIGSEAEVTDSSGAITWQFSRSVFGWATGGSVIPLEPGASFTCSMPWDQTLQPPGFRPGEPAPYAPPGTYTINGWLMLVGLDGVALTPAEDRTQLSAPPLTVVIQDGPAPPEQQLTVPAAPSDLSASAGYWGVRLGWSAGAGDATFNIYRRTAGSAYGSPIASQVIESPVTFTDLSAGVTYYYEVRGVGEFGNEGPPSNEVSVIGVQWSDQPPGQPGSPTGPVNTRGRRPGE